MLQYYKMVLLYMQLDVDKFNYRILLLKEIKLTNKEEEQFILVIT
jgi:hypothetical protein